MNQYWKILPKPVQIVIIILVLAVIVYLAIVTVKAVKDKLKSAKLKKELEEAQESNVTVSNGNSSMTINIATIATSIHEAFHGSYFSEDEERAITELKRVPKQFIPQLEEYYLSLFNKNLRADFVKYVSTSEWNSIKYLF